MFCLHSKRNKKITMYCSQWSGKTILLGSFTDPSYKKLSVRVISTLRLKGIYDDVHIRQHVVHGCESKQKMIGVNVLISEVQGLSADIGSCKESWPQKRRFLEIFSVFMNKTIRTGDAYVIHSQIYCIHSPPFMVVLL